MTVPFVTVWFPISTPAPSLPFAVGTAAPISTGTTSSTGESDGGGLSPGEVVGAAVGTVLTLLAVLVLATTGRGEP